MKLSFCISQIQMNLVELSLLLITEFSQRLVLKLQLIILAVCNLVFQLSDSTFLGSQLVKYLAGRPPCQCL